MNIIAIETLTFGLKHLIDAAEKFGCRLTLFTRDKSIYSYELGNLRSKSRNFKIIEVDTFNNNEIIKAVKKEKNVISILSTTDTWSLCCLEVSKTLKLPSINSDIISLVRDKFRLRNYLYDVGLSSVRGKLVDPSNFNIDKVSEDVYYPCIIKDTAGTGSQNVWVAYDKDNLLEILNLANNELLQGKITIEPFFEGTLYSIETLSWRGEVRVISITSRIMSPEPIFREEAFSSPIIMSQKNNDEINNWITSVFEKLGYRNGFAHTEFMITKDGLEIIEINPRLGGVQIGEALCRATGLNIYEAWIEMSLNQRPTLMDSPIEFKKGIGQLIIYANEIGIFSHVEGLERLLKHPGEPTFYPTSYPGKKINTTTDQRASIGILLAEGITSEVALFNVFAARNKLRVVMKN